VTAALQSVSLVLLSDPVEHCVADAIRSGAGDERIRELSAAIERLVRA
jgi:DNA-binding FrmR family transcriptional regulator